MNTEAPTHQSVKEKKGRLRYVSKRADAASTRYRIFQFIPPLEKLGWDIDYTAANDHGFLGRIAFAWSCRHYDIVIIQRKLFDAFTLKLLSYFANHLVFDFDDAIFLNDDGSDSPRRLSRFNHTTASCQLALAGNGYLAAHAKSKVVEIVPTVIDWQRYQQQQSIRDRYLSTQALNKTSNQSSENDNQQSLRLVWIGSRSTKKYLESHRDIFEALGKAFSNLSFHVIGDFSIEFTNLKTHSIPWSEEQEIKSLMEADIGVAPMDEDPWTKGKCALKIIQYMACGLPVVSSNTGANAEIVVENTTGFLAKNVSEWIKCIQALHDDKLRLSMGEAAKERVLKTYTVEVQANRMDALFTQLAQKK